MLKRNSFDIRKRIISLLKDNTLTLSELERKVNTNSKTIKMDCEELRIYGIINIDKKKHSKNGKLAYFMSLTSQGVNIAENIVKN